MTLRLGLLHLFQENRLLVQHAQCPLTQEQLDLAALAYRGGYTSKVGNGYVKEYNPFHRRGDRRGLVLQHRLVMERHLDRIMSPDEIVHHINGDKMDNRLENLELFASLSEHMTHHHKTDRKAACYDEFVIAQVRKAAEDPTKTLNSLDVSPLTVAKICRMYDIEWRHGKELTEEKVREALQGRNTREAAEFLGVHPHTLYYGYDHLLQKRKSPGFLDQVIEDVLQCAIEFGMNETARRYDTHRLTVNKALKKAGLWDAYQAATVDRVGGPQNRKQTP